MFNYETIRGVKQEEIFKKLANKTVRVVYVNIDGYKMWGVFDIEEKATYIVGEYNSSESEAI